jgi:DNA-binding beta-propeller fold protein YncE
MKYMRMVLLMAGLMVGAADLALAATAKFTLTDTPGRWFDTGVNIAGTRSLAIINPGDTVLFNQYTESNHTVTSLIYPSNAQPAELIDQAAANTDNHSVVLTTPGLYVFVCKVHPYMLGGVIVDDPATTNPNSNPPGGPALDIGDATNGGPTDMHLLGVGDFPSNSDLGLRLLRAFFIVTNPGNWKDYTKVGQVYQPLYPDVPVSVTGGTVVGSLKTLIEGKGYDGGVIPPRKVPAKAGVGKVYVDTQYELTGIKGPLNPGTISVVSPIDWTVKRKIALPNQLMNNGHNMWTSHDQKQLYQTEWHGKSLFVLDRVTGTFLQEIEVGPDPAHVMTRVDTQQVHVGLNGGEGVVELNRDLATGLLSLNTADFPNGGVISMQDPNNPSNQTQPHAHWMGFDGKTMVTPNANTNDSTLFDFNSDTVTAKNATGALPIAAALMPDSSKYYVSNYLSHSVSVMNGVGPNRADPNLAEGAKITDINLLQNYDPLTGTVAQGANGGAIGGLPIQTPVSPDGKFVITGNTLTGTITIIDTATNLLVKSIACDPGCHGVNFGAKAGGGWYAYVTSKFANRLIVLDYDPNGDGDVVDAKIAGWVNLARTADVLKDDVIVGNKGMGGQGVLPVPVIYNGWVQQLPVIFKSQLTAKQRNPFPIP